MKASTVTDLWPLRSGALAIDNVITIKMKIMQEIYLSFTTEIGVAI